MKVRLFALAFVLFALALRAQTPAALDEAIEAGDVEKARAALDAGADVDAGNATTPLTYAVLKHAPGERAMTFAKLFVSREADVNRAADVRPLYAAILREDAALAAYLVGAGADADVAGCLRATMPGTTAGESARALAMKKGEPYVSIVSKARAADSLKTNDKKGKLARRTLCSD
ncbi:MAG TPA: ankyrin repeat domain-containing protein [Planctomycetota bacterium]|nr:ankyrin repeat domain-containing protein [Planctomycetota bacterium]